MLSRCSPQPGHAPADVTAGVADALVATACGIFIAMLGLAGFNALSNQVRSCGIHQLDSLKLLYPQPATDAADAPVSRH